MNMYKTTFFIIISLLFSTARAQVTFDMELSETRSDAKMIPHTSEHSYADSITVKGYVAIQKKGICGDICAGGTIKFELSEKIEGYPHSYVYLVTACSVGETTKDNIELFITKYTGKEKECYYKDIVDIIDSKGVPYYKISEAETKKTVVQ